MLKNWEGFCNNLLNGIKYYRELVKKGVLHGIPIAIENALEFAEKSIVSTKSNLYETIS